MLTHPGQVKPYQTRLSDRPVIQPWSPVWYAGFIGIADCGAGNYYLPPQLL